MKDEIVEEVRRIRKSIEKKYGDTWEGLAMNLLKKREKSTKRYFIGQPRRLVKIKVA